MEKATLSAGWMRDRVQEQYAGWWRERGHDAGLTCRVCLLWCSHLRFACIWILPFQSGFLCILHFDLHVKEATKSTIRQNLSTRLRRRKTNNNTERSGGKAFCMQAALVNCQYDCLVLLWSGICRVLAGAQRIVCCTSGCDTCQTLTGLLLLLTRWKLPHLHAFVEQEWLP